MSNPAKQIHIGIITILAALVLSPLLAFAQTNPIRIELNPTDDPNNDKPTLSYEIKPTKSVEDVLTIHNYSTNKEHEIKVYSVDSIQGSNGASAFKLENKEQVHIGQWVTLNHEKTTIPAGETIYIPYRIDIPENSTPGTYQGGLVLEICDTNGKEESVKIVTRFIEPIFVSIPGRKKIDYALEEFSHKNIHGHPEFYVKFSNTGNVFLKGEIDIEIEGTLLSTPYYASLNQPSIIQKETLEKSFIYKNAPILGIYTAKMNFQVMEYDVINNELKIIETINKEVSFTIIPYLHILCLIIILILMFVGINLGKQYKQSKLKNTFEHKVQKGETIISLAKIYHVNWKKIAKLNKLHSPYTIHLGDILIFPFPKPPKESKKSRSGLDKKGK